MVPRNEIALCGFRCVGCLHFACLDWWNGTKVAAFRHVTTYIPNHVRIPIHTNQIEGLWRVLKTGIPKKNFNAEDLMVKLRVMAWRKVHESDIWAGVTDAFRRRREALLAEETQMADDVSEEEKNEDV